MTNSEHLSNGIRPNGINSGKGLKLTFFILITDNWRRNRVPILIIIKDLGRGYAIQLQSMMLSKVLSRNTSLDDEVRQSLTVKLPGLLCAPRELCEISPLTSRLSMEKFFRFIRFYFEAFQFSILAIANSKSEAFRKTSKTFLILLGLRDECNEI